MMKGKKLKNLCVRYGYLDKHKEQTNNDENIVAIVYCYNNTIKEPVAIFNIAAGEKIIIGSLKALYDRVVVQNYS